jgi:DNA-binding Lrp family transcriptional regulator
MKAYVLICLKSSNEEHVLQKILKLKTIEEAHILFGEWDIIAEIKAKTPESLAKFVMDKIRSLPEVKLTSTLIVAK